MEGYTFPMDNDQCVAVMHTQAIRQCGQGRPHVQIAGLPLRNAEGLDCFASGALHKRSNYVSMRMSAVSDAQDDARPSY